MFLNAFESRICPIKKPTQRKTTKTLRTKQILHRIPISLAQVKPGKTSEDSHGEILNLLGSSNNQTKIWIEINDLAYGAYDTYSQITFKCKSNLG